MEQPFSTSKVSVEYSDPHDVFKLLKPGLVPRLPLRNLHWQSHTGPLRSIDTLHIELFPAGGDASVTSSEYPSTISLARSDSTATNRDDGFQTQVVGRARGSGSIDATDAAPGKRNSTPARRHQIPGLRRTPYLKVLLVRCDDNDEYKNHVRQEVRDWIKDNTTPTPGTKKQSPSENHDAFEWLVVHVVIPNTVAATQPRTSGKSETATGSEKASTTSRWRGGSTTLLDKLRSDFNNSAKGSIDRISQIRIGINDVPYDLLPRVVPAVPSGYSETEQDSENAWNDMIAKFTSLILSSFDLRVGQYEEDIKEKDGQKTLPGWNFCTFFVLKEGLARGFESVGLVEDALVIYDELSVGLDMIISDQTTGNSGSAANTLLTHTEDLKKLALKAQATLAGDYDDSEEPEDLQSSQSTKADAKFSVDVIPISAIKKPYREMILENNVSVFDFRCYIFARQIALLLRLGNAWSSREELLSKLKEQQDSILHGVAPRAPPPKQTENDKENLTMLSEICRRTLEFIPIVSQVTRNDILAALSETKKGEEGPAPISPALTEIVDNMVASLAFSIAQQILAQTSTKALPIPPSSLATPDAGEPKSSIPEPKTMIHPARHSSLTPSQGTRPPPSPNFFPGPGARMPEPEGNTPSTFLKSGLEDLAARRAELYSLSRNILEELGKKRGWSDGWESVPVVGESSMVEMVEIDLNDDSSKPKPSEEEQPQKVVSLAGLDSKLLQTALDAREDFYRLYEIHTDKALRHFTVAGHTHSVQACMADLAVLKYHLGDFGSAASYFWRTTPFFGENGWSLLELSMLIMYSKCLKQLQRKDELIRVLLKLLTKAASAERERRQKKPKSRAAAPADAQYPDDDAIRGVLDDLLAETKDSTEVKLPLVNFISSVEVQSFPLYSQPYDRYSLVLKVTSLLADDLKLDSAMVRIVSTASGPTREILLELPAAQALSAGDNLLALESSVVIPGAYEIDKIEFKANNLCLHYEREVGPAKSGLSDFFKFPRLHLYHRADGLDIRLASSDEIRLDGDNGLDLELDTGATDMLSAEVRVKAATGGLRLLTSEAKGLGSEYGFSIPTEPGLFIFEAVPSGNRVKIYIPYTVELEVLNVAVRIDVVYKTKQGAFTLSKTQSVPIALALGVNVQDVFKHNALYSRFTVSTSSESPLQLLKSELLGSEIFDSHFGAPPNRPVLIFPSQPASLLYKITRKPGVQVGPKTQKTLHLKLSYRVLHDEIEDLIITSLKAALRDSPLWQYSRLVASTVTPYIQNELTTLDLERAGVLNAVSTSFLTSVNWIAAFSGYNSPVSGDKVGSSLSSFISSWLTSNPALSLSGSTPNDARTILIPVDIPSITVVHTADIKLSPLPSSPLSLDTSMATVTMNQVLPATLHLKWTRQWNTATPLAAQSDIEFSYELTGQADTWLLGGRRRGHFVIPAPLPSEKAGEHLNISSTLDTEADIPILLIPLREGYLPFPGVDIREVRNDVESGGSSGTTPVDTPSAGPCETDFRNLGETVRVVPDRSRVTLSLDASGTGGGPLVLEIERRGLGGEGRVVA